MSQIALSVFDNLPEKFAEYKEYISTVNWQQVATVVVAGVGVVLAVLIVFVFILGGFGNIASRVSGMGKNKSEKVLPSDDEIKITPLQNSVQKPSAAPAEGQGISGEIIAAITAAIAAEEGNSNFVIRSVKRKNVSGRNPWAMAAIAENTRPF